MKKIAIVLALALACIGVFAACGKKQETPATEPASEVQTPAYGSMDVPMVGGWTVNAEDEYKIPDDAKAAFDKAFDGFVGVGYTPIALLGTQVVSGTNYLFFCHGTTATAQPVTSLYAVQVYADLEGNASISGIAQIDIDMIETLRSGSTQEDTPTAGGWTINGQHDDAYAKLDEFGKLAADSVAQPGPGDEKYDLVALLATQVVAGTKYAFLQTSQVAAAGEAPTDIAVAFATVGADGKAEAGAVVSLSLAKISNKCLEQ